MADPATPPAAPSATARHSATSPVVGASPSSTAVSPFGTLFRRHRRATLAVAAVVSFGAAVTAFAIADDSPLPHSTRIVEELRAPDTQAQLEALAAREDVFVAEERVRRGDTVGALLTRLGVSDGGAETFLRSSPDARALRVLRPGRLVQASVDADGSLRALRYAFAATDGRDLAALATGRQLVVERQGDDGFVAHEEALANERRVELRTGEIRSSLFAATDDAGLPDGIATQIAEIFSGDIDFYRDLRRGDRFRVVYESFYQGGEFVRAGRILAIEFVNGGKPHAAMWYGGADSADTTIAGHYYGFDGHSLRRAFLRSPLEFTRISSGFGGRLHPISNLWRQHTGVDYAAPQGTPVRTTADGVVEFAGQQNGYGNVVIVRHQGVYSTLYGHLSAFAGGLRRGQHIEQGALIGLVGMTGWATGPHLHYEFRVSDHATDPLKAVLPEAPPIGRADLASFRAAASRFDRQIELLRATDVPVTVTATAGRRASPGA